MTPTEGHAAVEAWRFTKRQVEQYQFNGPGFSWAIITLDPRGIFQAVSDFGTYAYSGWGGHSCASFKHFLVRLKEPDYFVRKVCENTQGMSGPGNCGQVFSFAKTMKRIRTELFERRRELLLTKDGARACWKELEQLDDSVSDMEFVRAIDEQCPETFKLVCDGDPYGLSESCCYELAAGPLRFFEEIFRGQLVPALEAEIAAEGVGHG